MVDRKDVKLKLFRGMEPAKGFWTDLDLMIGIDSETAREVIGKGFDWFRFSPNKADRWPEELSEKEKRVRDVSVRIVLFALREGVSRGFIDSDYVEDFKLLGLSEDFVALFVEIFGKRGGELDKELEVDPEYISFGRWLDLEWRIDRVLTGSATPEIDELRIVVRMRYQDVGYEGKALAFELDVVDLEALHAIIGELKERVDKCLGKVEG